MDISCSEPIADEVVRAIHRGDVVALTALLDSAPGLAAARLHDGGRSFSLLHVATDWPGHFPNVREVIDLLVGAGADVGARYAGPHEETPLHWAASSDDVTALDALLDRGADIEADGGVIDRGADIDWVPPWEDLTPLDAAERRGAQPVVDLLRSLSAKTYAELGRA